MCTMVSRTLAHRAKGESGFTLVELLVVVIIIGILAAVSVPIYLNQRKKAWNSNAQSDVKNTQIAVETALVDTGGRTTMTSVTCVGMDGKASQGTITTVGSGIQTKFPCSAGVTVMVDFDPYGNNYTITGWHESGDKKYFYDSAVGKVVSSDRDKS